MKLGRRAVMAIASVAATVCVAAGVWQIERLGQRRARNAVLAARRALPPIEVRGQGLSADSARERRIVARGVYDFARERVWPLRSFDATPGVALITPLRLADGSAVLVDRGWVPSPDAFHVDRGIYREADTATVEGLGVIAPRGRADADPRALRDSIPYALLPFVLQQTGTSAPAGLPRRWPTPVLDNGPHLSYVIQWFSLALIIGVGTAALLRKTTVLASS